MNIRPMCDRFQDAHIHHTPAGYVETLCPTSRSQLWISFLILHKGFALNTVTVHELNGMVIS